MGKVRLFLIFVAIVSLFIASACSPEGSQGASGDNEGNTTITYWSSWNTGEPQQKVIQDIIEDFEEANPDITIDVEWMGRKVVSKINTAFLSGNPPNLTDVASDAAAPLIQKELTQPFTDLLKMKIPNEDITVKSVIIDGLLNLGKKDGEAHIIPYEVISSGLFYNENLFKSVGVETPKTWNEFITAAKKIKSQGVAPLALDGNIGTYNAYYYYWLLTRTVGSESFLKAAGDKTGKTWNEPGYLESAQKVAQLADEGLFMEGYSGSQYPAAQTAWAQGEAAMILNGTWLPSETSEYSSKDFKYRSFAFPEVKGGKGDYHQVESSIIGWEALKGANMKAVNKFLAFAMQKKYMKNIVTKTKNITARKDVAMPDVLSDFKTTLNNATGFHPVYQGVPAKYPKWFKTVFIPLDNKLVFGKITAEEFISQIQQGTKDFWAQQ